MYLMQTKSNDLLRHRFFYKKKLHNKHICSSKRLRIQKLLNTLKKS